MSAELERARRYRLIARRLRTIAGDNREFRQPLILTADDYDKMANVIEAIYRLRDTTAYAAEASAVAVDDRE